ncbi:hypothetical protein, variant 2 [Aphanomyces invadans]|nr:hypothetical protein, variant 1 [Aphanomyces invadans]XP_008871841.1 hypothetical protein, variant 2 [Aphanomyces invadans]ETV99284.1 hypothetical protein, variant 1 [Aphanomyces invadans]ETV99285.1 hypothetical protein, variant 2 [Aphanomyces invadans]|eukprot:XP_008871840.1 hypothetical protein, variant 1 [Aphanomyces invadans]
MTSGSSGGLGITAEEYPACIQDLLFQMDNHTNAFSVTSAAYDLKKVIEDTQAGNAQVFVYALSYGTYLVERLMQLESPAIAGYVVDSVVSQSAPDFAHMATFSNWDKDVAIVGDRFLALCGTDAFCSAKFNHANVSQVTWGLYASLDNAAAGGRGTNTCADMVDDLGVGAPSDSLRSLLGTMLQSPTFRELIPPLVYRLVRCHAKDVEVVQTFLDKYVREEGRWSVRGPGEDSTLYYSELLYGLIVYSEMWQHPTPSYQALFDSFRQGIMGGDTYALVQSYCTFTGSVDAACAEFNLPPSAPFRYEPDIFWNVTATVPAHASALLMAGGLDPQTEIRYARAQYADMKGHRRLIEFPQAAHCTTFSTHRTTGGNTCGVKVLASYVLSSGVLDAVDTSCLDEIIPVRFDSVGGNGYAAAYFGTADAFDGETSHYTYVQQAAKKGLHGTIPQSTEWVVAVGFLSAAVVMAVAVAVRSSVHLRRLRIKCEAETRSTDPAVFMPGIAHDLTDDEDRTPGTPPDPVVV